MSSESRVFHVTVAFRHGYGESFSRLDAALDYAETQMHTLLAQYEELENEDFDGIYCERQGVQQYWRFEHAHGAAVWMPFLEGPGEFSARVGGLRQGATLMIRPAHKKD